MAQYHFLYLSCNLFHKLFKCQIIIKWRFYVYKSTLCSPVNLAMSSFKPASYHHDCITNLYVEHGSLLMTNNITCMLSLINFISHWQL